MQKYTDKLLYILKSSLKCFKGAWTAYMSLTISAAGLIHLYGCFSLPPLLAGGRVIVCTLILKGLFYNIKCLQEILVNLKMCPNKSSITELLPISQVILVLTTRSPLLLYPPTQTDTHTHTRLVLLINVSSSSHSLVSFVPRPLIIVISNHLLWCCLLSNQCHHCYRQHDLFWPYVFTMEIKVCTG